MAAPAFSQPPGFFTGPVTLDLSSADHEAVIVYTLDGREPIFLSPVYDGPLTLESRAGQPNTISLIPTNFRNPAEHYGWRPPAGEVFKINVVRARAFRPGLAPSPIITGSYIIDPDLAGQIPLPVVSLNTTAAFFFADDIGIYVPGDNYIPGSIWSGNYYETGDLWERPVHLEIFDQQGNLLLAQTAGARMHGWLSRHLPQKTFRLYARSHDGPSRFECTLFPDLPYDSYNRFLIRNSGGDWGQTGFRVLAVRAMVDRMGFDTLAGRPVIHFINGEYWGRANLRERYDRHSLARSYGVPEDEVALLVKNAEIEEGTVDDPANLAAAAEQMDLDNSSPISSPRSSPRTTTGPARTSASGGAACPPTIPAPPTDTTAAGAGCSTTWTAASGVPRATPCSTPRPATTRTIRIRPGPSSTSTGCSPARASGPSSSPPSPTI